MTAHVPLGADRSPADASVEAHRRSRRFIGPASVDLARQGRPVNRFGLPAASRSGEATSREIQVVEPFDQIDEVFQRTTESVESPDHDRVAAA